jgi:hypothetical protein
MINGSIITQEQLEHFALLCEVCSAYNNGDPILALNVCNLRLRLRTLCSINVDVSGNSTSRLTAFAIHNTVEAASMTLDTAAEIIECNDYEVVTGMRADNTDVQYMSSTLFVCHYILDATTHSNDSNFVYANEGDVLRVMRSALVFGCEVNDAPTTLLVFTYFR